MIMDDTAKEHYRSLQNDPDSGNKTRKSMFSKWTDGHHEIEYDPLLLAESLVIIEENEEKEDTMSPIPTASQLTEAKNTQKVTRRVSVVGMKEKQVISIPDVERKKSAIEEHERIIDALRKCGLLA